MTKPTALLMLSGGLDSVQVLHSRLMAGEATRTHYVHLRNWEGREPYEAKAVKAVLQWARSKGYGHLIQHTESTFDYGDIKYIVKDHNIWGMVAGIILANPANAHITQVLRTFHRDSVVGGLSSKAGQAAEVAWRWPIERLGKVEREFVYPQLNMAKAEIIEALPRDLLRLCWYCRRPQRGQLCHKCHTCKQVDAALRGEEWVPLDERTLST